MKIGRYLHRSVQGNVVVARNPWIKRAELSGHLHTQHPVHISIGVLHGTADGSNKQGCENGSIQHRRPKSPYKTHKTNKIVLGHIEFGL